MKNTLKTNGLLIASIVVLSTFAALSGIFSNDGPGNYHHTSVRGEEVLIYGKGIYKDMAAKLAPQGIAQDYVTLFVGIPLLIFSFFLAKKGSLRGLFLLSGTLGYFFVTYLFYTAMVMYNALFLVFVALLGLSFFAFLQSLLTFNLENLPGKFSEKTPVKFAGGFLLVNTLGIALLWLSIVVPPLLDGTIYPAGLDHNTTMIVQGFDLGLLLPLAFIAGWLYIKRRPLGYLGGPVYLVFLCILMIALVAKIIAITLGGANAGPALVIIPVFLGLSITGTWLSLKNIIN